MVEKLRCVHFARYFSLNWWSRCEGILVRNNFTFRSICGDVVEIFCGCECGERYDGIVSFAISRGAVDGRQWDFRYREVC